MNEPQMKAYYSKQQRAMFREGNHDKTVAIYLMEDGKEAEVTQIKFDDSGSNWDDAIYLGIAVKFLRNEPA